MPAGFKNKAVKPNLSRPVANLDVTGVTREWRSVAVQELDLDDIVAGMGLIVSIQPTCREEIAVEAGVPNSEIYFLDPEDTVFAFVKKES